MVIEELLVKLGFFSDLKGLKAFESQLGGLKKSIGDFGSKIEAAGLAVAGFFAHSLEGIGEQAKFARQIGVTVEQLQQLQYAAGIAGSSQENLNSSIEGLNTSIFEASEGVGGAVEVFGRLNIATTQAGKLRPTIEIFNELADKLKSLPNDEQEDFAKRLGINSSTILLLQKGSAGIAALSAEASKLGVYSEKDAEKAHEYSVSWRSLMQIFKILKDQIAIGLSPVFTDVVSSLTDWLKLNKDLIMQDITVFLEVVIGVLEGVFKVLGWVNSAVTAVQTAFGGFINMLQIFAISAGLYALYELPTIISKIRTAYLAATAAAAAFDFAAIGLVIALIAGFIALGVILQDIWVWFRGGDSMFTALFGSFKPIKQAFKQVFWWIVDPFTEAFKFVWKAFNELNDLLWKGIQKIEDIFSKLHDKVKGFFGNSSNTFVSNNNVISGNVPLTNGAQVSSIINNTQNSANSSSDSKSNSTVNITVNGGGNSRDVAEAVKRGIYDAARQTQRNNASPVRI